MHTKVEVDYFMPMSYGDIFVVDTQNRGLAVELAMKQYPEGQMAYVNLIQARHIADEEAIRLVNAKRARLLKTTTPPEE